MSYRKGNYGHPHFYAIESTFPGRGKKWLTKSKGGRCTILEPYPLTFAGRNGYLHKQEGRQAQQRPSSRCGARPPSLDTQVCAPVRKRHFLTGATALEVQQVNHHSRYDVSQRKRRDVPQEVPHGDNLLYGRSTPRRTHYTARPPMTRRLWALLNFQE